MNWQTVTFRIGWILGLASLIAFFIPGVVLVVLFNWFFIVPISTLLVLAGAFHRRWWKTLLGLVPAALVTYLGMTISISFGF